MIREQTSCHIKIRKKSRQKLFTLNVICAWWKCYELHKPIWLYLTLLTTKLTRHETHNAFIIILWLKRARAQSNKLAGMTTRFCLENRIITCIRCVEQFRLFVCLSNQNSIGSQVFGTCGTKYCFLIVSRFGGKSLMVIVKL